MSVIPRSMFWRVGAAVFVVLNAGGAVLAAAQGEQMHAGAHVALLLLGAAYLVLRPSSQAERQDLSLTARADERLSYLQQSVDAIALEVERIGEVQRFNEKLRAQPSGGSPPTKPPRES